MEKECGAKKSLGLDNVAWDAVIETVVVFLKKVSWIFFNIRSSVFFIKIGRLETNVLSSFSA
jgi:hypothetical protein